MDKLDYKGKRVLIIGGGVSGNGARYALVKSGAECVLFDDKLGTRLPDNMRFDLVVVSPSVPLSHLAYDLARRFSIPIISEIELGYRLFGGEIMAITGTNGKTTTTELVGSMLKNDGKTVSVCGNIGVSFSKCTVDHNSQFAALEVSSFQLENVDSFKPKSACILNVSPDHIDRHGSYESYIAAKLNIAKNQDESDYLVLSQDDIPITALVNFYPKSEVYYYSLRGKVRGAYLHNDNIYFQGKKICGLNRIKMQGLHNISNALAAICLCKLRGVSDGAIVETLTSFTQSDHRLKAVETVKGKTFYNDSKATNPHATIKAAESMTGKTLLILGGSDKGCDFHELFERLPKSVTAIFAIGQTADLIIKTAHSMRFFDIEKKETLRSAVFDSVKCNVENVLLSPACASFDMFLNYADRGEQFEKAVKELAQIGG